jgi:hypothetical protein
MPESCSARTEVLGLVITSGKPGTFLAGADIHAICRRIDEPAAAVLQRMTRSQATSSVWQSAVMSPWPRWTAFVWGWSGIGLLVRPPRIETEEPRNSGFRKSNWDWFPVGGARPGCLGLSDWIDAAEMIALDHRIDADRGGGVGSGG